MIYNVPFVANPDDECVPATIAMVVQYFMPERNFTLGDAEQLCGYEQGKGTWSAKHMLALADMGFALQWIEDFDNQAFVKDPESYLRKILKDPAALEYQITHSDLPAEASRIKQYLDSGLLIENRAATFDDVKRLLDDGWLVRLEVNANPLRGKPGYVGHSVLVIGYDETGATLHNPDGFTGNLPAQHVDWDLLHQAWQEFGGSYSLYAFKK